MKKLLVISCVALLLQNCAGLATMYVGNEVTKSANKELLKDYDAMSCNQLKQELKIAEEIRDNPFGFLSIGNGGNNAKIALVTTKIKFRDC